MILVSACLAGLRTRYDGGDNLQEKVLQWVREGKAVLACPEQLGGLSTPRLPAEIVGGSGEDVLDGKARVMDMEGNDVTDAFLKGAEETLRIARMYGCKGAVLKESSPSCGSTLIYDGTFSRHKIPGQGVTAALLRRNGVEVFSEKDLSEENKLQSFLNSR
ncbi:conserved hypothetical protein [[Clostridium] ultunense Esp]|nr:conserved hypothetical protein [[Clostridium] ultunense Esp]